jgi:hypothetical protein
MKKIIILQLSFTILSMLAIDNKLFSQPIFEKTYKSSAGGEIGEFAGPASGSGIVVCGKISNANLDGMIMKTDNSGVIQWSKTLAGSGDDVLNVMRPTSDAGYIAVGYTTSAGAGGKDVWLVKLTSTGTVSWSKTYGTTMDDIGYDVSQTSDGGYIITGDAKKSLSSTSGAVYLIKTDNAGVVTWSNMWGADSGNEGRTVIQTSDGGYFVGGSIFGYFLLIKTTSTGAVTWSRANKPTSMGSATTFQAIQTTDGGYAIIGNSIRNSDNNIEITVAKMNSTGMVQWWKTYGGVSVDFGMGIQEVSGGNFLAIGYTASVGTFSDPIILNISSAGTLTSAKTTSYVGTNYDGVSLTKTADGDYVYTSTRNNGIYLFKSDGTGYTGCAATTVTLTTNTYTPLDNATPLSGTATTTTNTATFTAATLTLTPTAICSAIGIDEEIANNYISAFPNPANHSVEIKLDNHFVNGKVGIKIYDLLGKIVYDDENALTNLSAVKINVHEIPDGIYMVNIYTSEANYSKRLVIQH